jgi:hypothetical protein
MDFGVSNNKNGFDHIVRVILFFLFSDVHECFADVLFRNRGQLYVVFLVAVEMMGIIVSRLFCFERV